MAAEKAKEASHVSRISHIFFLKTYLTSFTAHFFCSNLFCFKGSLTPLTKDIEDEMDSSPCKSSTKDPIGEKIFHYI